MYVTCREGTYSGTYDRLYTGDTTMHAALYVGLMVAAALAFTIGGVFMKWSNGLTQTLPTLAMLAALRDRRHAADAVDRRPR